MEHVRVGADYFITVPGETARVPGHKLASPNIRISNLKIQDGKPFHSPEQNQSVSHP